MPNVTKQNPGFRQCKVIKRNGEQCGKPARKGLEVCTTHGGGSKKAVEAGLRRWELEQAEKKDLTLLQKFGADIDPQLSVIDQYDKALATAVAWLEINKQQLERLTSVSFETQSGERKLDARINLFERALDRVEKFLNNAQHLDLEERRVRVTETQQRLVAEAWGRATQHLFSLLRDALAPHPEALEALTRVEQQAPAIARQALTQGTPAGGSSTRTQNKSAPSL